MARYREIVANACSTATDAATSEGRRKLIAFYVVFFATCGMRVATLITSEIWGMVVVGAFGIITGGMLGERWINQSYGGSWRPPERSALPPSDLPPPP